MSSPVIEISGVKKVYRMGKTEVFRSGVWT